LIPLMRPEMRSDYMRSRPDRVNVDLNPVTFYGGIFELSDTLCDRMAFLPNEKLRT
jgi:hypothetical protein